MDFHYFLAVDVERNVAERINEWCERKKREWSFQKWVHQEDYHLTLAFLGAMKGEQQFQMMKDRVRNSVKGIEPFSLSLSNVSSFGRKESPRILWVGVEDSLPLLTLQKRIFEACVASGFSLDPRPFAPHITIARKWVGRNEFSIQGSEDHSFKDVSFHIDEIFLFETHRKEAPKYKRVERFQF
ncbi:RNA 2',3'-cyclic phosphodiesterase [Bacillus sp. FJAT-47783]|uniref:RNA 2',3'-cyclic phosphodiesterase n=1 Tax=Bacillus sp. FJAT-47783 TaxID=2922712 RepID=UPI001FACF9BD|nr:RNA 2',3'-cyclic phosphodiesterase [Bacillus sp. FJAT-47783]